MTQIELLKIKEDIEKEYHFSLPIYLKILETYYPQYLQPPKLEDIAALVGTDKLSKEEANGWYRFLIDTDERYNRLSYRDPLYHASTNLSHIVYINLYTDDSPLNDEERNFLYRFSSLVSTGRALISIFSESNWQLINYIDSPILNFQDEDIIIRSESYVLISGRRKDKNQVELEEEEEEEMISGVLAVL